MATDLPPQEAEKSLKDFFEKVQPGRWVKVDFPILLTASEKAEVKLPLLELHCSTEGCNGFRFFKPSRERLYSPMRFWSDDFIDYECKNCERARKVYAVRSTVQKKDSSLWMMKFGEDPPFGPPTPARVITLVGSEKDYYLKGRHRLRFLVD